MLEGLLTKAGLQPLLNREPTKYADWAYLYLQYNEIKDRAAFKDFLFRISQIRQGAVNDLLSTGGLDKLGKTHESELRTVIYMLNVILTYVPNIEKTYNNLTNKLQERESKKNLSIPSIHGRELVV